MDRLPGIIVVLALLGGGYYIKETYMKPASPANLAYQQFAGLVAEMKWDEAAKRAKGSGLQYVEAKKKEWYMIARRIGPDTASREYRETTEITYSVESESVAGNTTSLTVIQSKELRNPNNLSEGRVKRERHQVQLEQVGGGYVVTSVLATKAE